MYLLNACEKVLRIKKGTAKLELIIILINFMITIQYQVLINIKLNSIESIEYQVFFLFF